MPRADDEYDDYDDRPDRSAVPFPNGVRIAGIIWIGIGTIGILNSVLSFALHAAGPGAGAARQPGQGNTCGVGCGVLIAVAFLTVGIQTVRGTAKGMLGNGIGSIVFGLLQAGVVVLLVVLGGRLPGAPAPLLYVVAGLTGLSSVALLTAGMLAITGRDAYAEWLAAQGRGGRRPRTAEEEDYDDEDRPRRRPARDDLEDDDRPRRRRRDPEEDDDR